MAKQEHAGVSVEMIAGGHLLMRFEAACATQILSPTEIATLSGKISVSVENLEAAKTLRDELSAFITFHTPLPEIDQSAHFPPTEEQLQHAAETFIAGAS